MLSAPHSSFVKRVAPFLVVVAVSVWTHWSSADRSSSASVWTSVAWAVVLTVTMIFVLRRGLWVMADTVELLDNALRVQRWTTQATIPLSGIKDVAWEPCIVGSVVTLELRRPNAFGAVIRFYAPDPRKAPSIIGDLESLAARVRSCRGDYVA